MPFCRKCGHEVDSDDQFCYECGAPVGPTVGQEDRRGKVKAPKKPTPQEARTKPLVTKREETPAPEEPLAKAPKESGKGKIVPPVMKPQPIAPTQTVTAEETPTEAPKKAGKFRLRWLVIPVAAVAIVAIGVATWWFAFSSPGKLIFKDNFSNTDSGWELSSAESGSVTYSNGELKMQRKTDGFVSTTTTNDNVGEQIDFIAEVDARKISETEDKTDCTILFRLQDNQNFYGFYVQPRGYYSVWKLVENKWTKLIDWTESDYVKTGTSTNKLKVVCQGQKMDFYINGHKVDTINDNTFTEGEIALSITSLEESPTTEYRFDNFRVYALKTPVEKEPTGKLLFEDDFGNTDSGWGAISSDWGSIAYSNGELAMQRKTAGEAYTIDNGLDQQTDFAVEIDARKIPEGMEANYCGIYFRFRDVDNYYGFYVNSQGQYDIGGEIGGKFTLLKDWTQSDYIKTSTATNKLKVACKGNTIEVYANGHKLATVEDNSFAAGGIGLCVGTYNDTPTTEYRFDNFKLYEVGAVTTVDNYPNVTSFSVSSTSTKQGETLTFSYSVSDDIGLKQVELWREDSTAGVSFRPMKTTSVSGKSYTGSFSDAPSAPGAYWYGLHAVDTNNEWNCERNSRTGFSPGVYGPIYVVVEASE